MGLRHFQAPSVGTLLILSACSSLAVPMNEPLRSAVGNTEYRLINVNRFGGSESALVLVALSGGGSVPLHSPTACCVGCGISMCNQRGRTIYFLDEVDLLVGVSGGAFPAAHFGLYGEASFETFPEAFLYPDIDAYIWETYLLPRNWDWLVNPLVGTNDRMTQVYDRLMFHGATFADLVRRGRPQLSITATDMASDVPLVSCRRPLN